MREVKTLVMVILNILVYIMPNGGNHQDDRILFQKMTTKRQCSNLTRQNVVHKQDSEIAGHEAQYKLDRISVFNKTCKQFSGNLQCDMRQSCLLLECKTSRNEAGPIE